MHHQIPSSGVSWLLGVLSADRDSPHSRVPSLPRSYTPRNTPHPATDQGGSKRLGFSSTHSNSDGRALEFKWSIKVSQCCQTNLSLKLRCSTQFCFYPIPYTSVNLKELPKEHSECDTAVLFPKEPWQWWGESCVGMWHEGASVEPEWKYPDKPKAISERPPLCFSLHVLDVLLCFAVTLVHHVENVSRIFMQKENKDPPSLTT